MAKYRSTYSKHTCLSQHLPYRLAVLQRPATSHQLPSCRMLSALHTTGHCAGGKQPRSQLSPQAPLHPWGHVEEQALQFVFPLYGLFTPQKLCLFIHSFVCLFVSVRSGVRKRKFCLGNILEASCHGLEILTAWQSSSVVKKKKKDISALCFGCLDVMCYQQLKNNSFTEWLIWAADGEMTVSSAIKNINQS